MLLAKFANRPGFRRVEMVNDFLPSPSAVQIVTVNPNEWKNGRIPSKTSSGLRWTCSSIWCALLKMLRWERTTPLGSPVDPEVKITVASSSSRLPRRPGTNRLRALVGTSLATAAAQSLLNETYLLGDVFEQDQRPFRHDLELGQDLGGRHDVRNSALLDGGVDNPLVGDCS